MTMIGWLFPSHLPEISKKTNKPKQGESMKRLLLLQVGMVLMIGPLNIGFAHISTPTSEEVRKMIRQTKDDWSFERLDATHQLADAYYKTGEVALGKKDYVTAEGHFFSANTDSSDNMAAFCCLRQAELVKSDDPDRCLGWIDSLSAKYNQTPYVDTALLLGANVCLGENAALKGSNYLSELSMRNSKMLSSSETNETRQKLAELSLVEIDSRIASHEFGTAKELVSTSRSWIPGDLKDSLNTLEHVIARNEKVDNLLKEGASAFAMDNWGLAVSIYRQILFGLEPNCEEAKDKIALMVMESGEDGYGWSQETTDRVIQEIIKGRPEIGMDAQMVWIILGKPDYTSWDTEVYQEPVYNVYQQQTGTRQVEKYYRIDRHNAQGIQVRFKQTGSDPNNLRVVEIKPLNH